MALKDFAVQTKEIRAGNTSLTVRGVSFDDVIAVLYENKSTFELLVDIIEKSGVAKSEAPTEAALQALLGEMSLHVPYTLAGLIAHACDEPESWKQAMKLPAPVQIEAVTEIAKLTFVDWLSFEKFVGNVVAALKAIKAKGQSTSAAG